MRIAATSDIHGNHRNLPTPPVSDVMVFAGDILGQGFDFEWQRFIEWCARQPVNDVVIIAGNHDWFLEDEQQARVCLRDLAARSGRGPRIHYLADSGVTIAGVKFWGSPWTPKFYDWAFMKEDDELAVFWGRIPSDTDVLISHGPPYGILDKVPREHTGSRTLLARVQLVQPVVHIFGHIHEQGGKHERVGPTDFYNVAGLNENYRPRPDPWTVIEVERR